MQVKISKRMNWGKQYEYKKRKRKVTRWRLGLNTKLSFKWQCAQTMLS